MNESIFTQKYKQDWILEIYTGKYNMWPTTPGTEHDGDLLGVLVPSHLIHYVLHGSLCNGNLMQKEVAQPSFFCFHFWEFFQPFFINPCFVHRLGSFSTSPSIFQHLTEILSLQTFPPLQSCSIPLLHLGFPNQYDKKSAHLLTTASYKSIQSNSWMLTDHYSHMGWKYTFVINPTISRKKGKSRKDSWRISVNEIYRFTYSPFQCWFITADCNMYKAHTEGENKG